MTPIERKQLARGIFFGFLSVVILAAALAYGLGGDLIGRSRLVETIASRIESDYVDYVPADSLIDSGIAGMFNRLDPYSEYLPPANYRSLLEDTQGHFGGLGIEIVVRNNAILVIAPLEGTPAARAGLLPGDRIVKIDGRTAAGMTGEEAVATLRGPQGSAVTIEVKREGLSDPLVLTLKRDEIEVKAVPYAGLTEEGIGYVRLTRFSESAPKELAEALTFLQTQNPKGIILDLRSNPGGLLGAAVGVAGLFLGGEKLVVETRGRRDEQNKKYTAGATALCPDLPLVVAVDEYTASAAEIVAGAIQDWDRGLVIGRPTFGKGLVQTPIDLPNGAALKLTTARYFIPSGRTIQRPDRARALSLVEADSAADSSAHQPFHTKGGRTVYGMGGVVPDLAVERTPRTPVEVALIPYFFDFAVYYLAGHPEVPADFTPDAAVRAQFKKFLAEKKFSYRSQTEDDLALLEGKAAQEGYSLSLRQAIRALRGRINKEKEQALAGESEFISWQIKEQVLGARYGERAIYPAVWLHRQPELLKAREILTRSGEYRKLLALDSGQSGAIAPPRVAR